MAEIAHVEDAHWEYAVYMLACAGDYYVESLMTAACFGDQRHKVRKWRRCLHALLHNGCCLLDLVIPDLKDHRSLSGCFHMPWPFQNTCKRPHADDSPDIDHAKAPLVFPSFS